MWEALMDQLVTFKRNAVTQDAMGGRVFSLATLLSNVKAAVQSAGSSEEAYWARRDISCDDVVYCVADLDTLISGGTKINDVIVTADGVQHAVTGVRKEKNVILGPDPLYEIATTRTIPAT